MSAETPEACAGRFTESFSEDVAKTAAIGIVYLFEVTGPAKNVFEKGLDGSRTRVLQFTGSNAKRQMSSQVLSDSKDPAAKSSNFYFADGSAMYLFRPADTFSAQEVRPHVLSMCRLRKDGLELRQVTINSNRQPA
jgi:hypothetical protein